MNRDLLSDITPPAARLYCEDERLYRFLEIELAHLGIEAVPPEGPDRSLCLLIADTDKTALPLLLSAAAEAGCPLLAFGETDPGIPPEAGVYLRRPFPLLALEHALRRLTAHATTTAAPLVGTQAAPPAAAASDSPVLSLSEDGDGASVATVGNRRIPLTPTEAAVLRRLCDRPGEPVSRDELCSLIGGGGNSVDVYICHLRRKIEKPLGRRMIATVRGKGYIWQA